MVLRWESAQVPEMKMMRRVRCWRIYRRLETIFLGGIFIALSCLLYQVLSNDHVTVMSWFGVKVNQRLSQPRQKLISSMDPSHFKHPSQLPNKAGLDQQEGLFVDNYHRITSQKKSNDSSSISVAIGCAITSRSLKGLSVYTVGKISPFLRSFLPSFCKTLFDNSYLFKFFLAYDSDDPFFSNLTFKAAFRKEFERTFHLFCPAGLDTKLYFVRCPYSHHPAWSQNDAMFTAYLDNTDYFYRVNDDTSFASRDWLKILITSLSQLHPPNIGVVGPAHTGGNEMILAYDFVHKSHMDIFGFYYPRTFVDWWADDWISGLYGRERTRKLDSVKVIHTGERGTRYNHSWASPTIITNRILQDRRTLDSYLSLKSPDSVQITFPKGKKVISMSLYGDDPKYTYGAVRNAVLTSLNFPGWILRVYVEKPRLDGTTIFPATSALIIKKLKGVGAEIAYVDTENVQVPPMMWRYLVADDPEVDYFIVRDTDSRLISRDAEIVAEWLEAEGNHPFHCIRDHPSHRSAPIFGGLLGGKSRALREVIRERWRALMRAYKNDYGMDIVFLSNSIWPRVKHYALCHDSISCRQWGPNAWPFPSPRRGSEHVGQVFSPYGEPRSIDEDIMKLYPEPWECTLREGESRKSWLLKQKANARAEANAHAQRSHGRSMTHVQEEVEEQRRQQEEAKIPSLVGKVVFWSMDYETAYVQDLKNLLGPRGVHFIDKSLADDCASAGTCPHNLTIISAANGMDAGRELANKFYERYKEDPEMKQVTHFLCFRPVAMCEMYSQFGKSVVAVATRRYEEGRLTHEKWRQLNANLTQLQGERKNIIGANNHYDVEYMRYFTGFDPEYLPAYCGYAQETVTTTNRTRPEYLISTISDSTFRSWFLDELQKTVTKLKAKVKVAYVDDLYPKGHSLADLAAHPGVIHVPEKISDIRVCEQYRLAIPLYFPSLELLAKWHTKYNLLKNRTFSMERLHKHGISISGSPIRAAAMGRFDPNDEMSGMSLRYWLRFADFLNMPNVGHYETLEDLVDIIDNANPRVIANQMQRFNHRFKIEVITKWINLINRTLM